MHATNKLILNDNIDTCEIINIIKTNNKIDYLIYITNSNHIDLVNLIKNINPNNKIYIYIFSYNDTDDTIQDIILNHKNIDKIIIYKRTDNNRKLYEYIDESKIKICRVITFGTFDLFHIGHKNILERASKYGNDLIVGVSSDELNKIKGKESYQNVNMRINKIKSLSYVKGVFIEESLELKDYYIQKYDCDLLIMGDDWKDKFNFVSCLTIYLTRTPNISSTLLRTIIKNQDIISNKILL